MAIEIVDFPISAASWMLGMIFLGWCSWDDFPGIFYGSMTEISWDLKSSQLGIYTTNKNMDFQWDLQL